MLISLIVLSTIYLLEQRNNLKYSLGAYFNNYVVMDQLNTPKDNPLTFQLLKRSYEVQIPEAIHRLLPNVRYRSGLIPVIVKNTLWDKTTRLHKVIFSGVFHNSLSTSMNGDFQKLLFPIFDSWLGTVAHSSDCTPQSTLSTLIY